MDRGTYVARKAAFNLTAESRALGLLLDDHGARCDIGKEKMVAVNWMATPEGLTVSGNNQLRGGSAWTMRHPGMQRFLDYPDVASLAAPKPMLMLAGEQDALFPLESVHAA